MSEKHQSHSPESLGFENIQAKSEVPAETQTITAEQQAEHLETARQTVQELAPPKERLALPIDDNPDDNRPLYIDRVVKGLQLKQSLKQVRSQLPLTSRALSKVVHQPAVKAVSEVSAKTVTRPSGLLGGGLFAFVGSLGYLYLTTHIGFQYNYLLFSLFFVGGFIVGLIVELALRLARPRLEQ